MSHDPEKDPGRSEYLNDYYSQTIVPDLERTFYTKMLGLTDGHCDYVTINENEQMESITIYFDEELIRVIEFRFSSNRVKKVGMWTGLLTKL